MEPLMATLDRSEFGPNQWLIDEMYRRFREDPGSVGDAWREFFEDYTPRADGRSPDGKAQTPTPDATPAPADGADSADGRKEPAREAGDAEVVPLRGAAAVIAERMEESLEVPTATSVR